jgi:hypothetical protein
MPLGLNWEQGGTVRNRKGNLKSVTLDAPAASPSSTHRSVKEAKSAKEDRSCQPDVFLALESDLADGSEEIISPAEHRAQMERQIVAAKKLAHYAEEMLKGLSR